jgi:hypothetical protein
LAGGVSISLTPCSTSIIIIINIIISVSAATKCDERVSQCAKPSDVEKLCVSDQKEGKGLTSSLRAILADEQGPLRRAVNTMVKDAQVGRTQ